MKLVVITSGRHNEDELVTIIKMLEAGLDTLHVRKPKFSTKELSDYIKSIPEHFHNRLIIHSHFKLAVKYKVKGIHFTSSHFKRKYKLWWILKWLNFKRPDLIKTMSYRRISDVYIKEKYETDYCFLGTMFHNITGTLYSGFHQEAVEAVVNKSGKKIIVRGGINEKSIEKAYDMGLYGVALYGYLWKSNDPLTKYIQLLKFCKEKNIPID